MINRSTTIQGFNWVINTSLRKTPTIAPNKLGIVELILMKYKSKLNMTYLFLSYENYEEIKGSLNHLISSPEARFSSITIIC